LKQLGVSEDTPFFRFQNQEIAALFEPHLLKCTRNLFQKYYVGNVDCESTDTAKRQDILKLYEIDKRLVYRLPPKVTDRHVSRWFTIQLTVWWNAMERPVFCERLKV
jgi:hypothetical protein